MLGRLALIPIFWGSLAALSGICVMACGDDEESAPDGGGVSAGGRGGRGGSGGAGGSGITPLPDEIAGKAVCEYYCVSGGSHTSSTGPVQNPRKHGYTTGGSSSGSAALVAAGEVPLALTVYNYKPEQQKRMGAPVEPLYLSPVVALGYGTAVARCAPHPHAAVLFNEFMLGDALAIWAKRDMAVTNPRVMPLPPGVELTMIDPADMLDNRARWEQLWTTTVLKPQ